MIYREIKYKTLVMNGIILRLDAIQNIKTNYNWHFFNRI